MLVLEGVDRKTAAETCGMDRQTLRDWVHRYNAEGLAGLSNQRGGTRPRRLDPGQVAELVSWLEAGPDPAVDGVVRWRRQDLRRRIAERFEVELHERTVGKYLAALGYRRGLHVLVGGMCETDYSGYPDCRDGTLRALEQALRLGTEIPFIIETPLMWCTKAQTWALAEALGGAAFVDLIIEETHTCYRGERGQRHDWGYGCGTCPACELRAKGYAIWRAARAA